MTTTDILKAAKDASVRLSQLTGEERDAALLRMADALLAATDTVLAANRGDLSRAEGQISPTMLDRLRLTEERIRAMADGIRAVADLPDPLEGEISSTVRADGLRIRKVRVPLGTVGIIYESRPNVTSDAAALAIKSANACVLKCGKEAHESASAIVEALRTALAPWGLGDAIGLLHDKSRAAAEEMMHANEYLDALIPRGGAGLIRSCVEHATVPCIQTGTGICHVYVDAEADLDMALSVVENAKASRPSVCNAAEVCLVHRDVAERFLPRLRSALTEQRRARGLCEVRLLCDPRAYALIGTERASAEDFDTEFLDYTLAVAVVDSVEDAIEHIRRHSTHHSEAILTGNRDTARRFTSAVDSAAVYVNASTRFTDGGEFGLGCEIGISTQKLHARGPMGLSELTTYKYVIEGNGHIRI